MLNFMKTKLLNLLKFSAYLEFTDVKIPVVMQKTVTYRPDMKNPDVKINGPAKSQCPPGPHYRHRKFFLWSKRPGWKWGNKMRKAVNYWSLNEGDSDKVGMVSQVIPLKRDTASCVFWNGKSLIIDLDAYDAFLKPRK